MVFDEAYIYFIKEEDGTYTLVNNDDKTSRGKLTQAQFTAGLNAGTTYYSYGKPNGAWWFMLSQNKSEKVYTVNEMGDLMSNVTQNVLTATLSEMRDAGLITAKISAYVPVSRSADGYTFYTRDANLCTVDQLINAISLMTTDDNGYAQALMEVGGYSILPEPTSQTQENNN
jgi:hypothetical protein